MMAGRKREESIPIQQLLEPVPVSLSPRMATLVEENVERLRAFGLQVEPFGSNTALIRGLPAVLTQERASEVLLDVAEGLEASRSRVGEEVEEVIVRRICKRAAVKAGQVLTREEMEELVRGLERCDSPRTCPHGRPTLIRLSADHLAREFGRK
jgi:DNA mismatch repair protein MutL